MVDFLAANKGTKLQTHNLQTSSADRTVPQSQPYSDTVLSVTAPLLYESHIPILVQKSVKLLMLWRHHKANGQDQKRDAGQNVVCKRGA